MLELQCPPWHLALHLQGGVLLGLWHQNRAVLRDVTRTWERSSSPGDAAAFPMVPVCNRVFENAFSHQGTRYELSPNIQGQPHYLHGEGWLREWKLADQQEAHITLTLDVQESAAPWRYHAWQVFRLSEERFEVEVGVRNTGLVELPFGVGWHPYFAANAQSTLKLQASHIWSMSPDFQPLGATELPTELNFSSAEMLPPEFYDCGFLGWNGVATLQLRPQLCVEMRTDPAPKQCFLYRPLDDQERPVSFLCLEPMSHGPNAVNDAALVAQGLVDPMTPLAPQAELLQRTHLRVIS